QLVDTEDGDDVLQVAVALQDPLDLGGDEVVLLPHDLRVEGAARGVERVDRRVDAQGGQRTGEHRGGVEVGERRVRRRVGDVVGGDVDRLQRGDRPALKGRDALLEEAHLVGQ